MKPYWQMEFEKRAKQGGLGNFLSHSFMIIESSQSVLSIVLKQIGGEKKRGIFMES